MPLAASPKCYLPALCTTKTMSLEEWIERLARSAEFLRHKMREHGLQ